MPVSSKLLKYSSWNLAALIVPLLVGLVTIPYLLNRIGIEKFGVLSLIWALVGYFSLFDFGLAKALTKKLAEGRVQLDTDLQRRTFWTSILLMLASGLAGWFILVLLVQNLGDSFIKVSAPIGNEVHEAMLLVAAFVPLVVVSSGLRGALEAYEHFRSANLVRLILGIWMFLIPAMGVWLGYESLWDIAAIIVFGRVVAAWVSLKIVSQAMAGLGRPAFDRRLVRPLFSYGAWITLSGVVGPLMSYADRFLVGAIVGAAGVAYYATPQDVVMKLLLLPVAINTALFPILAQAFAANDRAGMYHALGKALRYAVLGVLPFVLAAVIFSNELLALWLGNEMAGPSAPVLQLIAAGVFVNGIGVILVSVLNAGGRHDVLGKLYLVELPLFLAASYFLTLAHSVAGAAWAWMLRAMLDTVLIWYFAGAQLGEFKRTYLWAIALCATSASIAMAVATTANLADKAVLFLVLCGLAIFIFEKFMLAPAVRNKPAILNAQP